MDAAAFLLARVIRLDTLRLRIIKTAVRVVELKQQVRIYCPSSNLDWRIFNFLVERLAAAWLPSPRGSVPSRTPSNFNP